MKPITLFNTYIHPSAYKRVKSVLDSTFLSEGKLVQEFEQKLEKNLGLKNPVALNSGTSALHLALVLAGVKRGDEVICPAQTFVATAMAIVQQGATPVFADIQYLTGNIDPASIKQKITKKTKAIMAVHWGGYPCDMDEIHAIAAKHGLVVIEDAAHAPGAMYKGRPIGSLSEFTCFSFQAIKHITTGDGGAICCKDPQLTGQAFARRWFGIDRNKAQPSILGERIYNVSATGYKYHMNDYSAALGLANLENFNKRLARRHKIAKQYSNSLANIMGLSLFTSSSDRKGAYWLYGFHVEKREDFIKTMKNRGIFTSVVHIGIDRNQVFGNKKKNLVNQRKFDKTQIHIPIHDALTDEQVEYIINSIKKGW